MGGNRWDHRSSRAVAALALALALLGTSGCATIVRGKQARVQLESLPSGATVWVDGQLRGKTPVAVTVSREELHTVRFTLDGHEEVTVQTDREISVGYVFIDILFGAVWLAVDGATGAWYDPGPRPLRVLLSPTGQQCASGDCVYLQAPAGGGSP